MIFEQIAVGGDRNYAYLIAAQTGGEAAVVDPAYRVDRIMSGLERHQLTLKYIINTHGHYDHVDGNAKLKGATDAKVVMHDSARGDIGVKDGDTLMVDTLKLTFIYTPGHTSDSICILADNKLVTGDTLFVGKVGGTGFGQDAQNEYDSLHQKLMILPDDTEVWPGHNYGTAPSSTIGTEKSKNPFLLQKSFDDFVD